MFESGENLISAYELSHYTKSTKYMQGHLKNLLGNQSSPVLLETATILLKEYGFSYLEDCTDVSLIFGPHFTVLLNALTTLGSFGGIAKFSLLEPKDAATLYRLINSEVTDTVPDDVADGIHRFKNHLKNVAKLGKIEVEDSPAQTRKLKSKTKSPLENQKRTRKEVDIELDVESFQGSPVAKRPKRIV